MDNNKKYPNVTSYRDRFGKTRWRFRKAGFRPHHFTAPFGSVEFEEEYGVVRLIPEGTSKQRAVRLMEPKIGYRRACHGLADRQLVYFIGGKSGPVKIGHTRNVSERLKKLQTGYHRRLYLLAVIPGGAGLEADLHARFGELRLQGEWFRRSPEMIGLIEENTPDQWRTVGGEVRQRETKVA